MTTVNAPTRKPVAALPPRKTAAETTVDLDSIPLKAPERRDWNTGSVEVREYRRQKTWRVVLGGIIALAAVVGLVSGPIALHMLGIVL